MTDKDPAWELAMEISDFCGLGFTGDDAEFQAVVALIRSAFAEALEEWRSALESMVMQFACDNDRGEIHTGGLSALEEAFDVLGWDDPHQLPAELLCAADRCSRRATCGRPAPDGYRRECGEHYHHAIDAAREGGG